jgi:hypothetical protein
MAYSGSMHFSDKLSYKKHFISSYGSKDMNFAISAHLQQFSVKQIFRCDFSHREELSLSADRRGQGADCDVAAEVVPVQTYGWGLPVSEHESNKKIEALPELGFEPWICFRENKGTNQLLYEGIMLLRKRQ